MAKSILLKVTPEKSSIGGHYVARSFEQFNFLSLRSDLSSLSAMLGGDKFTEVYIKTKSGNIYKIFQERNEFDQPEKWVLVNKNYPTAKYYPTDAEMYYGFAKLNEKLYYGNGGYTTEVSEIVCVNSGRIHLAIATAPEATLVQQFNTALKGKLAVKTITDKM